MRHSVCLLWCFFLVFPVYSQAQQVPAGFPVMEEQLRRNQLFSPDSSEASFLIRPTLFAVDEYDREFADIEKGEWAVRPTPIRGAVIYNTKKPYWQSPQGMIPGKGGQLYLSGGVEVKSKYVHILFQPEFNVAQNSPYQGYSGLPFPRAEMIRFQQWNRGDSPERFGDGAYTRAGFGQSKATLQYGAFELGVATHNIWWGPGQWNSLTFSNNAPGFPHLTFNTHKPAKTFFGQVEMQLLSGLLNTKRYPVSQISSLNQQYHRPRRNNDRYLNALNITVQPKWLKGLHVGASRTVQVFSDSLATGFIDILPVFWGITKESVGSDLIGESDRGRDQQITVFFRYAIPAGNFEFYGEFGRRDHALNWRDFILNPAHARAYLLGFTKLIPLERERFVQVRGELTHQKQSLDIYTRAIANTPWHTNEAMGGFTNWDQPMGVGIGMGSNIQMLEVALVEDQNKVGLIFERLDNNPDFYTTADLWKYNRKPWVDMGIGVLLDRRWDQFLLSSKLMMNRSFNYQWQVDYTEIGVAPRDNSFSSLHMQVSMIYFLKQQHTSSK
ncbi:capsule assembly Wzi family protein [Lunatibacter salilacus]|uniref:capsule assembly Wzi family protein n=1 Tax=Lunatibacter salilacus TaxID=2483804 RepID=UPI00131DB143|nr:capsule assembly Wzi family protein [Lunatibacter salilacus]